MLQFVRFSAVTIIQMTRGLALLANYMPEKYLVEVYTSENA